MTRPSSSSDTITERLRSQLSRLAPGSSYKHIEPNVTNPEDFTVSDPFVCAYLEARSGRKLTETSVSTYENHLGQFVAFLESREVNILDAEFSDIIAYVENCVDIGNRQSTLNGKLTAIRELYVYIRLRTDAAEVLTIDPIEFDQIEISEYNTPPPIDREPLNRQELRKLFDAMNSYRNRLIVIVAAETGLRNSDLRNIRVTDVDFDACEIHVRDPKNAVPYDVPISRELRTELEIWCDQYRAGYGKGGNGEFLFPAHHGERLKTNSALNDIVTSAAERAGVQETIATSEVPPGQRDQYDGKIEERQWNRVTVHTLRHTCFTLMEEAGVPLPYRQLVANHRNPRTTQKYSHGRNQEFSSIRDRFDVPR